MIEFRGVSKLYKRDTIALDNINLTVDKGEFLFLVGPSGAGKSTLLRLLYREEKPTEGRIYFNGRDISGLRARQVPFLRRQIGVVFQDFRLLPDRTVYENVAFAMRVVEAGPREIRKRVPAVLELVGLLDKARSLPEELSGGEQQRVSVARALVNSPMVILADEPTGNLDPETSENIINLLTDVNALGTTVIVATHDRDIVDRFRRRVVALQGGRVVRDQVQGVYTP